jgi:predicted Zn-dependent protease
VSRPRLALGPDRAENAIVQRKSRSISAVATAAFVLLAAASDLSAQLFGLSERQEIELGREAAAQVEREQPILEDERVESYIDDLGQFLVEYSGRKNIAYQFKVVDSAEINAFALPGGFIYVNRGLIEEADNESELVGVMGHEIGHVVERHSVDQVKRAQLTGLGLGVLDLFVGGKGTTGELANIAGQMVASGAFMKYSRDAEREADRVGAQNVYDAGWDPRGMMTFFEKLAALGKRHPNAIESFFSTHPKPDERAHNITELIASFPADETLREDSERFHEIKSLLQSMPPSPSK